MIQKIGAFKHRYKKWSDIVTTLAITLLELRIETLTYIVTYNTIILYMYHHL